MLSIVCKPVLSLIRKLEGKGYTVAVVQKTEDGIEFQVTKQFGKKIAGMRYCMLISDILYSKDKPGHVQNAFGKIDKSFRDLQA